MSQFGQMGFLTIKQLQGRGLSLRVRAILYGLCSTHTVSVIRYNLNPMSHTV